MLSGPPDGPTEELLTSDEVVERLFADAALHHKAATCVLRAVRVGSEWRFRRADLEEWIAQQLEPTSAKPAAARS